MPIALDIPGPEQVPVRQPRNMIEAAFFNAGVIAALQLAAASSDAVVGISRRPIHEGFAAGALDEFARSGRALLFCSQEPDSAPRVGEVAP